MARRTRRRRAPRTAPAIAPAGVRFPVAPVGSPEGFPGVPLVLVVLSVATAPWADDEAFSEAAIAVPVGDVGSSESELAPEGDDVVGVTSVEVEDSVVPVEEDDDVDDEVPVPVEEAGFESAFVVDELPSSDPATRLRFINAFSLRKCAARTARAASTRVVTWIRAL